MTQPRIDLLAKWLAQGLSRRRLLGGLGGLGGGAVAAGLMASSKPSPVCQHAGTTCDESHACCPGASCRNGRCTCRDGWEACDDSGICVNHDEDNHHCGRCGKSCAETEVRKTCCGGGCVDVEGDRANCGACGVACGDAELCVRGTCVGCPIDRVPCGNACCAPNRCDDGRCLPDGPAAGAGERATTTDDRG